MSKPNIIPEKLIKRFIKQERLSGIVDFLSFLNKMGGLKKFFVFCEKNNCKLPIGGEMKILKLLFHGSQEKLSSLTPNLSIGENGLPESKALVYATDLPNYAIFLSTIILKNARAGVAVNKKETILSVDLDFVNGPSKIKNGYLHLVRGDTFKKTKNSEYISHVPVEILFTISVSPGDLTIPIYIQTGH